MERRVFGVREGPEPDVPLLVALAVALIAAIVVRGI
jgi:hypothetical protein